MSNAEECVTVIKNSLSNVFNIDGVCDGKNLEVCTFSECAITNPVGIVKGRSTTSMESLWQLDVHRLADGTEGDCKGMNDHNDEG